MEGDVRERERVKARRRLDAEMRHFRRAALERNPTNELLRAVRQVLGIPVMEVAGKMGVDRSVLYGLEMSERRKTITLKSLNRVAKAMGCRVIYGVVPVAGLTLEELAEERMVSEQARERGGVSGDGGVSETASQQVSERAS
jgi:transcriptional regulator with XRE-family HTH domain